MLQLLNSITDLGVRNLQIFALVGKSGSGKSHRAQYVSRDYGIEYIIDDGLLINGNRVVAGVSAKKENTRISAVKRAIFIDPLHRQQVKDAIEKCSPQSILILGTSLNMIERIVSNLGLPPVCKVIYIEDIASKKEIDMATKIRFEQGKHAIPVPTFAIKKDFSGYFIDSFKSLTRKGKSVEHDDYEKTVVRPTFSYLGKYTISNNVIKSMVVYSGEKVNGVHKITKVNIANTNDGLKIDLDITMNFGFIIHDVADALRESIKNEVEYMTAFNIIEINVFVKSLNL